MADVLTKSLLIATTCVLHLPGCGSSQKKASPSSVAFSRVSSFPSTCFESLRSFSGSDFHGRKVVVDDDKWRPMKGGMQALPVQMSLAFRKAVKWWEKGLQSNMKQILSAQDLVESLSNAGNKLVIVDFFSPGCGGCRALHPKICQFAEANPEVMFLQVNYEEHKSMCYSLNVHVLPFFRFYRGAHGRLCSFSCTNATIKKFKDALAKHNTDRCSLGPARGLEESELLVLAANKDLNFTYTRQPDQEPVPDEFAEIIPASIPASPKSNKDSKEKVLVTAWR